MKKLEMVCYPLNLNKQHFYINLEKFVTVVERIAKNGRLGQISITLYGSKRVSLRKRYVSNQSTKIPFIVHQALRTLRKLTLFLLRPFRADLRVNYIKL